jgi:hypothetical protein
MIEAGRSAYRASFRENVVRLQLHAPTRPRLALVGLVLIAHSLHATGAEVDRGGVCDDES